MATNKEKKTERGHLDSNQGIRINSPLFFRLDYIPVIRFEVNRQLHIGYFVDDSLRRTAQYPH